MVNEEQGQDQEKDVKQKILEAAKKLFAGCTLLILMNLPSLKAVLYIIETHIFHKQFRLLKAE